MATTPLIVGGLLSVNAVDFSDAITHATIQVDADEVTIPATLAGPKAFRKGGNAFSITINFLSNDTSATAELFGVLWTAITTGNGQLAFILQVRDGVVSASNPSWVGTFVATHAALGGDAEGLSVDSATFKLIAAPVRTIV